MQFFFLLVVIESSESSFFNFAIVSISSSFNNCDSLASNCSRHSPTSTSPLVIFARADIKNIRITSVDCPERRSPTVEERNETRLSSIRTHSREDPPWLVIIKWILRCIPGTYGNLYSGILFAKNDDAPMYSTTLHWVLRRRWRRRIGHDPFTAKSNAKPSQIVILDRLSVLRF